MRHETGNWRESYTVLVSLVFLLCQVNSEVIPKYQAVDMFFSSSSADSNPQNQTNILHRRLNYFEKLRAIHCQFRKFDPNPNTKPLFLAILMSSLTHCSHQTGSGGEA
jgi:hypothetical protein